MDTGGPLLDNRQKDQQAKQTMSHYSSFPMRQSVSTHDILSHNCSPTKQQQVSRTSGVGVWRTPFSQHPTPTPSTQPIRIDIPVTRAVTMRPNPPLTTFQSSSSLAVKTSQTLKANVNKQSPQNQLNHIYACPVPATKKLPQSSVLNSVTAAERSSCKTPSEHHPNQTCLLPRTSNSQEVRARQGREKA